MDTWHDVGHTSNLNLSWDKRGIKAKEPIFLVLIERERRREKEGSLISRSMEFRWLVFVGPRTKVHRINEGYAWVPGNKDFAEDPKREILGNRSC